MVLRPGRPDPDAAEIDLFLMSCRVLGRGVESAVLSWLVTEVRSQGLRRLIGLVVPSERNAPARSVYRDHGYSAAKEPGVWRLDLEAQTAVQPDWITLVDQVQEASRVA